MNPREIFEAKAELARKRERELAEIDDLLRTIPTADAFEGDFVELSPWIGRSAAVLRRWDFTRSPTIDGVVRGLYSPLDLLARKEAFIRLRGLLHEARADLLMDVGPLITVTQRGHVFDYFDELRKVIEPARQEVFFVDPYLDAEFVSRYLPHVAKGAAIRLLGSPAAAA